MGHPHLDSPALPPCPRDLASPFGKIDGLDRDDFREAAYEVFFTVCRSSPGFSGRSMIAYNNGVEEGGVDGIGGAISPERFGVGMAVTSRVKRALGLKMLRRSQPRRRKSAGSNTSSPNGGSPRASSTPPGAVRRRPMTSAEIMRQQMWVTEQSDTRLRKTLMRTLVGQMGRRAETIILPLELLRHLKPSEFADAQEYHQWQKRQLKVLEVGLLLLPSVPLENSDASAAKLRDIISSADSKPIDIGKNSETMKALCSSVVSLAWRGGSTDVCHWADGYPLNVEIYKTLLQAIFDLKEQTLVLDEVDELLELMKKTWTTLSMNRSMHNLCLAWVLFEQYVMTGQVEPELLAASLSMLTEVANDAKKPDREPTYMRMLASVLTAMKMWCEKRLLDYHGNFDRGSVGLMKSILPLVISATKILEEDVPSYINPHQDKGEIDDYDSTGNKMDYYIRSSSRKAFAKMVEEQNVNLETHKQSEMMIKLARETEDVGCKEKEIFSPILKKWHPMAAGVSAVTLHACYGTLLRQFYLTGNSLPMHESMLVLQRAGMLEKALLQMVVEESQDGAVVREMAPYEVDTITLKLLKHWMQEKIKIGNHNLLRAKETETWKPKSKSEAYAGSAEEIIRFCKETIENFFEIPINVTEKMVNDLIQGLEHLLGDYITFVASCGSKQSYLPTLPPLTRCSRDSKFIKLWRKAAACSVGQEQDQNHLWKKAACSVGQEQDQNQTTVEEGNHPRPSTSRGTQRLYIRLNTLHYLLKHLHSLDTTLANRKQLARRSSFFEHSRAAIEAVSQQVSEVAAYRLIFLDSNSVLYAGLYTPDVASSRVGPALRIVLKRNLTLLCAIVTDNAQPLALKEAMKVCFEAFLMVLLAGGSCRIFSRMDRGMIEEDLDSLKRMFCTCGEGLIGEDDVAKEAETVEEVLALMGQTSEKLVEDLGCQKLPMPPTTGKWSRSDPNTILRVLCHRNDRVANHFLKRTFHLAKRSSG